LESFKLNSGYLRHQNQKYAVLSGLIDDVVFFDEYESKIRRHWRSRMNKDINYVAISTTLGQPYR